MSDIAGLWIDHRKAVIASITDHGEEQIEIRSNVERQRRRFDGLRATIPYDTQQVPADDIQERAFTAHLNTYYDKVVAAICKAESVLIFGPGEAKGQLRTRIEHARYAGRILDVEAADEMTARQVAAKVRRYASR